jgi:hypothetical protein
MQNIFNFKRVIIYSSFIAAGLILALYFGYSAYLENPEGVLLYTPTAYELNPPLASSFLMGFIFGIVICTASFLIAGLVMVLFRLTRIKGYWSLAIAVGFAIVLTIALSIDETRYTELAIYLQNNIQ